MKRKSTLFVAILLIRFIQAHGQPFTNLVLEGAGVRGIAYVGAINCLEESNSMKDIHNVAGTSAGSIAALAIALGYTGRELEVLLYDTKLQKFNDGKYIFFGGFARMNRQYGWYRGETFTTWIEKLIQAKTGDADITFQGLHDQKFKNLYVTGTSLNNQKVILFSYKTYPQMKVKDAVRISMSIPLYFEALLIDSAGQVITKKSSRGQAATGHYDLVVDGGLTSNFPIAIFDSVCQSGVMTRRLMNPETIGIRMDTPEQIRYDSLRKGLSPIPITRFKNYIGAFYNYVIENLNRSNLTSEDWDRTISISSGDVGPKIRRLSRQEKEALMQNGYSAMKKFMMVRGYR